ncbi:hypothetical protein COLO4_10281 [Corchorus olitorius]|uniref:Uncharacterized protein n=1 Tax=Corchorus olitorius TaxID=93759 RepID=A0A1R3K9A8_9ROSI|nr:hypothetical protein COLO4_10281 [Corchorus olitorius]
MLSETVLSPCSAVFSLLSYSLTVVVLFFLRYFVLPAPWEEDG